MIHFEKSLNFFSVKNNKAMQRGVTVLTPFSFWPLLFLMTFDYKKERIDDLFPDKSFSLRPFIFFFFEDVDVESLGVKAGYWKSYDFNIIGNN